MIGLGIGLVIGIIVIVACIILSAVATKCDEDNWPISIFLSLVAVVVMALMLTISYQSGQEKVLSGTATMRKLPSGSEQKLIWHNVDEYKVEVKEIKEKK